MPERGPDDELHGVQCRARVVVGRPDAHVTGQERVPDALGMERESDRRLYVPGLVERRECAGIEAFDTAVERAVAGGEADGPQRTGLVGQRNEAQVRPEQL